MVLANPICMQFWPPYYTYPPPSPARKPLHILLHVHLGTWYTWAVYRINQNRIYSLCMTVYLVISLPKVPYINRLYMVLANPSYAPWACTNCPLSRSTHIERRLSLVQVKLSCGTSQARTGLKNSTLATYVYPYNRSITVHLPYLMCDCMCARFLEPSCHM